MSVRGPARRPARSANPCLGVLAVPGPPAGYKNPFHPHSRVLFVMVLEGLKCVTICYIGSYVLSPLGTMTGPPAGVRKGSWDLDENHTLLVSTGSGLGNPGSPGPPGLLGSPVEVLNVQMKVTHQESAKSPAYNRVMALPTLLALCAAALFGASTPVSKLLLTHLGPFQLAGLLYLGAALAVSPSWAMGPGTTAALPMDRRAWRLLGGVLVFGGLLGPVCLLLGLRQASASSVSLWLVLEMVATALLGVGFFRDHLGRSGWLGVSGAVAAGALLCWGEGVTAPLGAGLWVVLACLCWGMDNQCSALLDAIPPGRLVFWKGLAAGSANLLLGLLVESGRPGVGTLIAALLTGALAYGASIALYVISARQMGATRAQITFASAPFFGLLLSAIVLGEPLSLIHGVAALIFIGAAALLLRDRHNHLHVHIPMTHAHLHRHDDGHHTHSHPGLPSPGWHSHRHEHEALEHGHPHWPDLHHRHFHAAQWQ